MGHEKRRKSLTEEEKLIRRVRAKRRFKAIVRLAIANRYWLEDVGDEKLGGDVKKNVLLLLKKKKGRKSLLTLEEKALLNKPAVERTHEEVLKLNKIIGGFKCFRRYPDHVKMQLAGVSYFMYFGPGRVIVRQNHEAHALYFILTGEVSVSQENYDPCVGQYVTKDLGTMEPGQLFGEVSLLFDIPRTATIKTITPCEFLCLYRTDFDEVLKHTLQAEWDHILKCMSYFTYFDDFDERSKRECCIVSKIVNYNIGDVIYRNEKESGRFTYFIIDGECRVIEHIPVIKENVYGKQVYSIFDKNKYKKKYSLVKGESGEDKQLDVSKDDISPKDSSMMEKRSEEKEERSRYLKIKVKDENEMEKEKERKSSFDEDVEEFMRKQTSDSKRSRKSLVMQQLTKKKESVTSRQSMKKSKLDIALPDVDIIFMQVCVLRRLSCFGIGECLKHRKVVAITDVTCLQIPKYWILQKNKGNVWSRVEHYLNTHLPTSKEVFDAFIKGREWSEYKKRLVRDVVTKPPVNNINNVPYSIRLNYSEDTYY